MCVCVCACVTLRTCISVRMIYSTPISFSYHFITCLMLLVVYSYVTFYIVEREQPERLN